MPCTTVGDKDQAERIKRDRMLQKVIWDDSRGREQRGRGVFVQSGVAGRGARAAAEARKNSPPDTPVQLSPEVHAEIARVVAGGLGDLSLREILAASLNALSSAERSVHLKQSENDRGNGFYQRGLNLGSMPVDIAVPRVRSGTFRPSILPDPYKRGYTDEDQALFLRTGQSRALFGERPRYRADGGSRPELWGAAYI